MEGVSKRQRSISLNLRIVFEQAHSEDHTLFYWTSETFLLHCNNQYKPHDAAFPKIEMPAEHTAWRCFQKEQGTESTSTLRTRGFWRRFFIPEAPGVAAAAASSMRSPSSNSILLLYSTSFSPDLRRWLGCKKENTVISFCQLLLSVMAHTLKTTWSTVNSIFYIPNDTNWTNQSVLIKWLTNQESKSVIHI